MDSALKAALAQPARTTTLVHLELPSGDVFLSSGGQVEHDAETYHGRDAVFGVVDEIGAITDGIDGQASTGSLTLTPASGDAVLALADPEAQASPVTIWQGAVDDGDGSLIGVEPLFRGELNYASTVTGAETGQVRLELITEEARQLEPNDERRLSHSFHAATWPGELGLEHVTGITLPDFWRATRPRVTAASGGGLGGGGTTMPGGFVDMRLV